MASRSNPDTFFRDSLLPDDGPGLRLMHRVSHGAMGPHRHEFVEIVVVHAGECTHVLEGVRYRARAGDVFIVREGTAHGYARARGLVLSNILVRAELTARWAAECGGGGADFLALFVVEPGGRASGGREPLIRFDGVELSGLERLLGELERAQATRDAAGRLAAEGLLRQVVAMLLRRLMQATGPAARSTHALAKALKRVDERLLEPWSVAGLAEIAGVSERTLTRWFRQTVGCAPLDYVLRKRLARAGERLRADDASITEIAFACGFTDSNYFSRQFRRVHGCSPSAYRAERR